MTHGIEIGSAIVGIDPDTPRLLQPLARVLLRVNQALVTLGMIALLVASVVLTYSVISRYVMKASTDWQDEAAVFCLVGATFLCSAFVQALRGHVAIEAVAGMLPRSLNRLRLMLVDLLGVMFCTFFAWKSWTLFHEAWAEHQTTSSSWAPPLWIPYGFMAAGMTLLSLQLFVQLSARVNALTKKPVGVTE
ncbi:MAG TPA: TRAP transporter permease DctQ [Polaromonas sp.]|uniref:TRAP transporter small permease n=1 Tax=Polaromonas sp. UBA4122 TaxID=1947074 RepID=UPI000EED61DD|nr:TRAP transporter small permease [Polaromonas sp. UBA4122]HAL37620.1 TRAP transporter permease DctQ [Polaromonas sp.]